MSWKYSFSRRLKTLPLSVAKLRFAEDFWGWLKGKVSQDGWEADSEHQLKNRIKKMIMGAELGAVRSTMAMVKTNLRKAADQSTQCIWVMDQSLLVCTNDDFKFL